MQQLEEKIKHLEAQEDILRRQVDDLQEQNDLLEFRIIELDGANEKVSWLLLLFSKKILRFWKKLGLR